MGLNAEHSWADAPIVGHLWEVHQCFYLMLLISSFKHFMSQKTRVLFWSFKRNQQGELFVKEELLFSLISCTVENILKETPPILEFGVVFCHCK